MLSSSSSFEVLKRDTNWPNEVVKVTEPVNGLVAPVYGDRFIPRRYFSLSQNAAPSTRDCHFNKKHNEHDKEVDILKTQVCNYWRRHNYKICLNNLFGLNVTQRVISASDNQRCRPKVLALHKNQQRLDWACNPRTRPIINTDSSHELPDFKEITDENIIDWSSRNQIAASFDNEFVLWNLPCDDTHVYQVVGIRALAFNKTGNLLAAASNRVTCNEVLEIWTIMVAELRRKSYRNAGKKVACTEETTCIMWSADDENILCGKRNGLIKIYKADSLKTVNVLVGHRCPVVSIKYSCNNKYLASCDFAGNLIIRFKNSLSICYKWNFEKRLYFDWHPWQEAEVMVATRMPASLLLINVHTKETLSGYRRLNRSCRIRAIAFSKLSAELVVSYDVCMNNVITYEVCVLAAMDYVVDKITCHEDAVRFLLWSPDGKRLATAGDDDSLIISNFFGFDNGCQKLEPEKKKMLRNNAEKADRKTSSLRLYQMIR